MDKKDYSVDGRRQGKGESRGARVPGWLKFWATALPLAARAAGGLDGLVSAIRHLLGLWT